MTKQITGKIGEVSFWHRTLTEDEWIELWRDGLKMDSMSPVKCAFWRFAYRNKWLRKRLGKGRTYPF